MSDWTTKGIFKSEPTTEEWEELHTITLTANEDTKVGEWNLLKGDSLVMKQPRQPRAWKRHWLCAACACGFAVMVMVVSFIGRLSPEAMAIFGLPMCAIILYSASQALNSYKQ